MRLPTVVYSEIDIIGNPPDVIVELPALLSVIGANFSSIGSLDISVLQNTENSLVFDTGTLTSIIAPELVSVGYDLIISNFTLLNTLSFPKLEFIGGSFIINGNPQLQNITAFPALSTVLGSIDWTGSFDYASLPQLNFVGGGVNVQSSSNKFVCPFSSIRTNGIVHGNGFVCSGGIPNPLINVNGTNVTASGSGSTVGASGSFAPTALPGSPGNTTSPPNAGTRFPVSRLTQRWSWGSIWRGHRWHCGWCCWCIRVGITRRIRILPKEAE